MDEGNAQKPSSDKIQCIVMSNQSFLNPNIQVHSVFQNLCMTYNHLLNLNMEFSYSLNNTYSNIIVQNLPTIMYGKNFVRKLNIPYFFKILSGIDQELNKKDVEIKMYYEMIEKLIFSDLQMLLVSLSIKKNYYTYVYDHNKSGLFSKVMRYIYSPIQSIFSSHDDSKISREISKILNVSTRDECIEQIIQINVKIETFLASFGEDYYTKLTERNLNSIDLAIYSAIKTQMSALNNKFKEYNDHFQVWKSEFKILKAFMTSFDDILLNKRMIKNVFWSLSASDMEKYFPKRNLIDSSFDNYKQIIEPTEQETRVKIKRTMMISTFFIGFLFMARLIR